MVWPILCIVLGLAAAVGMTWVFYEANKENDGIWIISPFAIGPCLFLAMMGYLELRK